MNDDQHFYYLPAVLSPPTPAYVDPAIQAILHGQKARIKFTTKNSMTCSLFDESNNEIYRSLSRQTCQVLNELRCTNQLCDSLIKCDDGSEIPVHRAIMAG